MGPKLTEALATAIRGSQYAMVRYNSTAKRDIAGLVIGGAGVMGREYLDRSVHDVRALRDEFELPVLAEIPRIEPAL